MSDDFDALMAEMAQAGIDTTYIERVRQATAGSPLRKERDAAVQAQQALQDEVSQLRNTVLTATWNEIGAKGDPTLLRFPDGLDIRDKAALAAFAVEKGFADSKPEVPTEELEAHQRVASASVSGVPTGQSPSPTAVLRQASSEEDFWAKAQASGLTAEFDAVGDFEPLKLS